MELFLDQDQYVANLATEAGVKVLIHKRGSMPFPEDKGVTIMPGRSTSVGIEQVKETIIFILIFLNIKSSNHINRGI